MARREYQGAAVSTTITGGLSNVSTSLVLASTTGWPTGSFSAVIDPGQAGEEKILCTSRSGVTVAITTRGYDGTTASSHVAGATIYPVPTAIDFDEANSLVVAIGTLGTGVGAALQTNVGSAGAPVVLNGAGGTPSSINLTNATNVPSDATKAPLASPTFTGTVTIPTGAAITSPTITGINLGFATQATAASTKTLTVSSPRYQEFTGTTASQVVQMPVTSTLTTSWDSFISNKSTQSIAVNSSGGNLIATVPAATDWIFTANALTGTTAASWSNSYAGGSAVPSSPTPPTFIPLGDSTSVVPGAGVTWPEMLSRMSGGQLSMPFNAGVAGNTTTQMLARISADVVSYAPSYCVILGGTNDIGGAVPLATFQSNIATMCATLNAANIQPVLSTITPRNANADVPTVRSWNTWIKGYAQKNGYACIDFNAALVDITTSFYLSTLNADTVHPNEAGVIVMAQTAWNTFSSVALTTPLPPSLLPEDWSDAAQTAGYADHYQMIVNPLMYDLNADLIPDRWTLATTSGSTYQASVTPTVITDSRFLGKAMRWLCAAQSGFSTLKQNIALNADFQVGDRIRFIGKIAIDSASTIGAGGGVQVALQALGGAGLTVNILPQVWKTVNPASTAFVVSGDMTIPSSTTSIQALVNVQLGGGNMDLKFGQIQVINLTKLGL